MTRVFPANSDFRAFPAFSALVGNLASLESADFLNFPEPRAFRAPLEWLDFPVSLECLECLGYPVSLECLECLDSPVSLEILARLGYPVTPALWGIRVIRAHLALQASVLARLQILQ